ncbi:hypothetical protein JW859_08505 [bacterium]|nr:hypothetical protein [bacterium]
MDPVKLKPMFISDEAGRLVAVQVGLESFQHMLELLADLLNNGRIPSGVSADEPLISQLAGLLDSTDAADDPRELLEDLLDSVTLLRAKAEQSDYIDYDDVRADLLEPDRV